MDFSLADLGVGETAIITDVLDGPVQAKLLEMGLVPGERIRLKFKAPFGDPLSVVVAGYQLAIRKDVALSIKVKLEEHA
jgi:ferrous iron transport protein A